MREGAHGIEVLLLRRAERGDHNSGAWVFPGGIVEPGDALAHALCDGLSDEQASRRLGVASGGLDYYVAAIRECFEEAGLLFARMRGTGWSTSTAAMRRACRAWRRALHRGERNIADFCAAERLRLAVDQLVYFSHWLTPLGRPKRFDTRFFLAVAPPAQTRRARRHRAGRAAVARPPKRWRASASLMLLTPTQKTLETIGKFANVPPMRWRGRPRRARWRSIMPRIANGRQRPAAGDARRAGLGRARPHRPRRARHGVVRDRARPPGAPVGARDPRHAPTTAA